eukprot:SAG22_NODE_3816_length_1517_cov_2.622708_1_plen_204_part_10
MDDITDVFSHLTNYSVNKHSTSYNTSKDIIGAGAKWLMSQFLEHLKSSMFCDTDVLWQRICNLCCLTLLPLMANVPDEAAGCFELYGFDILIDGDYNPWLIEVNVSSKARPLPCASTGFRSKAVSFRAVLLVQASPALGTDGPVDVAVKEPLLTELFALLDFDDETTADKLDADQSLADTGRPGGARLRAGGGGNGKPRTAPTM